jgi:hypothetical protein
MTTQPSPEVARAAATSASAAPSDKLDLLRAKAASARDLRLEIDDLLARVEEKKRDLNRLFQEELPALMDAAGTDKIGAPPSGNKRGMDFELHSYYSASISAKWDPKRKEAAYAVLKSRKAEGLIRATIEARLPKGNLAAAKKVMAFVKKLKIKGAVADLKQSVHKGTLSAWLRETYEDHRKTLSAKELEAIGGSVGRVVRVKDRDDEGAGDDE